MASPKKTWNELYGPKPGDLTPQEWEQQTGNKLLSYSTNDGKLAMNMPMSYRNAEGVAEDKKTSAARDIRSNEDLSRTYGDINQSYRSKGYSPISGTGGSIARGELPSYTRTTTSQIGTNMASPKKTWNEKYDPQPSTLTPQESYKNADGVAEDKKTSAASERSSALLQKAYDQIMDRSNTGFDDSDGMPNMASLELASKRLADSALLREMVAGEYKGLQEHNLQLLRGAQEYGLQGLRGSQEYSLQGLRGAQERELLGIRGGQERELQQLRGSQEYGLQGLRGLQEYGLQGLRGSQEYGLQGLRGSQEYGLQGLRGEQEYGLQGLRGSQATGLSKFNADQQAKALGYTNASQMQFEMQRKRMAEEKKQRDEEYARKMISKGYVKIGNSWVMRYRK